MTANMSTETSIHSTILLYQNPLKEQLSSTKGAQYVKSLVLRHFEN